MKRLLAWKRPVAALSRARGVLGTAVLLAVVLGGLIPATALTATPASAASATSSETTILRSWLNGACLDSNYDGAVYEDPCNGGKYQNWRVSPVYGGEIETQIKDQQTGRCLTNAAIVGLITISCKNAGYWFVSESFNGEGQPVLNMLAPGGGCLDANSTAAGPPYVNPHCYTGGAQDWKPGF